jgi:hypothetical protein
LVFESWERYDIDERKMLALGAAAGIGVSLALFAATSSVMGGASEWVCFLVGGAAFYAVSTSPRRAMDGERTSQARDSPALTAAVLTGLEATGSGAKTIMALSSGDRQVTAAICDARRRMLLGHGLSESVSGAAESLVSQSARNALLAVDPKAHSPFDDDGREVEGIVRASDLADDTKLPLFMTFSFFTPIMLMLYAVLSHLTGQWDMVEMTVLEFAVLEVVYLLTAARREAGG